jgi:multidrug resistance efflux pump
MKNNKLSWLIFSLLLIGLLGASCSSIIPTESEPETTDIPVIIADTRVVADGMLVPQDFVDLAFVAGGEVAEVLVEEGDPVSSGDVLARLSGREQLESRVAAARLELQAAQSELLSAQIDRGSLDDDLPIAQTQALDAVTQAKSAVRTAERRVRSWSNPADQADIDEAKAAAILAEDALEKAQDAYEPYADKSESNLARANRLALLAAAQQRYDDAVRRLNSLQGTSGDEFDLNQAEAELQIAQSRLERAEADVVMFQEGPDPDTVALAESRITTAESRIATAESALLAAESALTDLDLVATMDGVVVDLNLNPGEQVSPGRPVITLADFSKWYVETDNLTEIEVVDISLGQSVEIIPDALPELNLLGIVESISDTFEEKRGDITYTTRILVDEIDPRLRWGMTVVVSFEE